MRSRRNTHPGTPSPTGETQPSFPSLPEPEAPSDETVRDFRDANLRRREAYERAFRTWVGRGAPATMSAREEAAMAKIAGVDAADMGAFLRLGVPELSLPSFAERGRDVLRRIVDADARGETVVGAALLDDRALVEERARAREEMVAEERAVMGSALSQRREEVELVRGVRLTAGALLTTQAGLLEAATKLSAEVLEAVAEGKTGLGAKDKVRLIRDVAAIAKSTAEVARIAAVTEQVILGKPGSIIGAGAPLPQQPTIELTQDEAGAYIAVAHQAFERAKARQAQLQRAEPAEAS